ADRTGTRGAQACNGNTLVSSPSSSVKGIAVDVHFTFNTLVMPVLSQDDLTVDASATAIYGPLGNATGGDLIPLTISQTAEQAMQSTPNSVYTFSGAPLVTGSYRYDSGNFGSVAFNPSTGAPNGNGNYSDCTNPPALPAGADNERYWWCNGSQYPVS